MNGIKRTAILIALSLCVLSLIVFFPEKAAPVRADGTVTATAKGEGDDGEFTVEVSGYDKGDVLTVYIELSTDDVYLGHDAPSGCSIVTSGEYVVLTITG
nr:hypothetical protein [Clostridiales bacterium]